jgi:hypothetical protein
MRNLILLLLPVFLAGCAGSGRHVQMSDNINLSAPGENTVFIEVHNSSIASLEDMGDLLTSRFKAQGYQVQADLHQAYYYVQLDVVDFGFFSKEGRLPLIPGVGLGVGTWGVGVGLGLGINLADLFSSNSSQYIMSAYLRVEETRSGIMHESSVISRAAQEDMTFQQGMLVTRDAMIDQVMSLFPSSVK